MSSTRSGTKLTWSHEAPFIKYGYSWIGTCFVSPPAITARCSSCRVSRSDVYCERISSSKGDAFWIHFIFKNTLRARRWGSNFMWQIKPDKFLFCFLYSFRISLGLFRFLGSWPRSRLWRTGIFVCTGFKCQWYCIKASNSSNKNTRLLGEHYCLFGLFSSGNEPWQFTMSSAINW